MAIMKVEKERGTQMNTHENYRDLANAIVLRALQDYRFALKRNLTNEIKKLERFFRSDWFKDLCNLDGEQLMKNIQRMDNHERQIRVQKIERSKY